MFNFFKRNFVIAVGIFQTIIILGCFFSGNKLLFLTSIEWSKYLGIIIFIFWLRDENYKFLYYFFYILSVTILSPMVENLLPFFIESFVLGKYSFIFFILLLFTSLSIISQLLYNFFRNLSYKKYKIK